jgi:hypothetical protein
LDFLPVQPQHTKRYVEQQIEQNDSGS